MPVIGHALVGIITAQEFEPGSRRNPSALGPVARSLWMPMLVALAYVPDVETQLGLWLGLRSAKLAGHSLFLGLPVGFLIGLGWARLNRGSPRMLAALAVASIALHNLVDLLQANDRQLFWPISTRTIDAGWLALPDRLSSELLVFGLPFAAYEAWRLYNHRRATKADLRRPPPSMAWASHALVAVLLLSAVTVQQMRSLRHTQMALAERLLRSKHFAEALKAADAADHWPATNRSRADIVRADAYEGIGNSARAELLYVRAYRNEPENFWAVAALAEYYASHGTPAERRPRTQPYVEQLRRRFAGNPDFRAVMRRIERAMAASP